MKQCLLNIFKFISDFLDVHLWRSLNHDFDVLKILHVKKLH